MTYPVWSCQDCYFTHVNGEIGDDSTPDRPPLSLISDNEEVSAGMGWKDHSAECLNRIAGELVAECECETITFSSAPCHTCGSNLGGMRFAMTIWPQEK